MPAMSTQIDRTRGRIKMACGKSVAGRVDLDKRLDGKIVPRIVPDADLLGGEG